MTAQASVIVVDDDVVGLRGGSRVWRALRANPSFWFGSGMVSLIINFQPAMLASRALYMSGELISDARPPATCGSHVGPIGGALPKDGPPRP